jgi:maltose alpha-D-glucosyltransferase/alpha-amylase
MHNWASITIHDATLQLSANVAKHLLKRGFQIVFEKQQRDQLISQFRQRASRAFLDAYWDATSARSDPAARALLDLFLIEKAAYEIAYEVANRPTWIGVPIAGLTRLVARILDKERSQ